MAKNFKELRNKMSPERRARNESAAKEELSKMVLTELRKWAGVTQESLASSMGVKQPTLSRLENQDDMHISTLIRLVESLGGHLDIIADLPGGRVSISQFSASSAH